MIPSSKKLFPITLIIISFRMDNQNKKYSRLQWTREEQAFVKNCKESQKIQDWKTVAKLFNQHFPERTITGKQCRERYMNYIRFSREDFSLPTWRKSDDLQLFNLFGAYGAKWVIISNQMVGKSESCLKNRFYGAIRKVIRRINKIERQKKLKYKKSIKQEFLKRVLHSICTSKADGFEQDEREVFVQSLRQDLITMAISPEASPDEEIVCLIDRIHQFNCLNRKKGVDFKVTNAKCKQDLLLDHPDQRIENSLLQGTEESEEVNETINNLRDQINNDLSEIGLKDQQKIRDFIDEQKCWSTHKKQEFFGIMCRHS